MTVVLSTGMCDGLDVVTARHTVHVQTVSSSTSGVLGWSMHTAAVGNVICSRATDVQLSLGTVHILQQTCRGLTAKGV
jgi:hypothetical protein